MERVHDAPHGLVMLAEVLLGDLDRAADHLHAGETREGRHEAAMLVVGRACEVMRASFPSSPKRASQETKTLNFSEALAASGA